MRRCPDGNCHSRCAGLSVYKMPRKHETPHLWTWQETSISDHDLLCLSSSYSSKNASVWFVPSALSKNATGERHAVCPTGSLMCRPSENLVLSRSRARKTTLVISEDIHTCRTGKTTPSSKDIGFGYHHILAARLISGTSCLQATAAKGAREQANGWQVPVLSLRSCRCRLGSQSWTTSVPLAPCAKGMTAQQHDPRA